MAVVVPSPAVPEVFPLSALFPVMLLPFGVFEQHAVPQLRPVRPHQNVLCSLSWPRKPTTWGKFMFMNFLCFSHSYGGHPWMFCAPCHGHRGCPHLLCHGQEGLSYFCLVFTLQWSSALPWPPDHQWASAPPWSTMAETLSNIARDSGRILVVRLSKLVRLQRLPKT